MAGRPDWQRQLDYATEGWENLARRTEGACARSDAWFRDCWDIPVPDAAALRAAWQIACREIAEDLSAAHPDAATAIRGELEALSRRLSPVLGGSG